MAERHMQVERQIARLRFLFALTKHVRGGWVGGGLMAGLCYFLLLKGMKNVSLIKKINATLKDLDAMLEASISGVLLIGVLWVFFAILIHVALILFRKRAARMLFPSLAVVGMFAMAFAFGQNDLANCASPGLSVVALLDKQSLEIGTKVPIASWQLLICGLLLFVGMTTKNADRVTKAAIATGSTGDHVALWAPRWCVTLAGNLLRFRGKGPALAPRAGITEAGKTVHFDSLRACVIMSVSASVIATASSLKLPVSTTYVAFAAIVATGMADRILQRGDAELKLGRAIWVVSSWVLSAVIAIVAAFLVATAVYELAIYGMVLCVVCNLLARRFLRRRADVQARRVEDEAYERTHPDEFALEREDE